MGSSNARKMHDYVYDKNTLSYTWMVKKDPKINKILDPNQQKVSLVYPEKTSY
jgi:hypothetical protein